MTENEIPNWFAVQTRPQAEAIAETQLRMLSIETLLPLRRRSIRHATRRTHVVFRPLFPGYLFARFCAAISLRAVNARRGVLRVLGSASDKPWPVDEAIVDAVRQRLDTEGCVELVERPFHAGDAVRIADGPLTGWSGIFDSALSDSQRVVIFIDSLRQGRVVIRRDYLELSDAA
jgi:transcriptional antiterminator RfaH